MGLLIAQEPVPLQETEEGVVRVRGNPRHAGHCDRCLR